MRPRRPHLPRPIALVAAALLAACADRAPTAPPSEMIRPPALAMTAEAEYHATLAQIRQATARYHDLDVALADGFVLLHECESLPGEGAVGIVYFYPTRVVDGEIDPAAPEALIYEPSANGRPKLVGVEFAVLNDGQDAPTFLGATFQAEDEVDVFALHAWVWRHNPDGMFAPVNPNVSCGDK